MTCTCTPMSTCAECAEKMVTDAMVQRALVELLYASKGDLHATSDEMRAALVAAFSTSFAAGTSGTPQP